jgi:hypothetical protein
LQFLPWYRFEASGTPFHVRKPYFSVVSEGGFSEELARFIAAEIKSVEQLEILFLLPFLGEDPR